MFHHNLFSKPNLSENISSAVCFCLQESITKPDSTINYMAYKTCMIPKTKSLKKEIKQLIKKMELQFDIDDDENDNLWTIINEIDVLLSKNCPVYSKENLMDYISFE